MSDSSHHVEKRGRPRGARFGRLFLWAVLCCAIAVPAIAGDTGAAIPIGAALNDAGLRGLNGPSRKLSAYLGRPLIINVWASWCGPCRAEMASLERLAWRDSSRYFSIIGISTDDEVSVALSLLKESNATISQFIDSGLQMETMLGASRLPLTVLVDARGIVLAKIYGAREWDAPDQQRLIDTAFHKPPRQASRVNNRELTRRRALAAADGESSSHGKISSPRRSDRVTKTDLGLCEPEPFRGGIPQALSDDANGLPGLDAFARLSAVPIAFTEFLPVAPLRGERPILRIFSVHNVTSTDLCLAKKAALQ